MNFRHFICFAAVFGVALDAAAATGGKASGPSGLKSPKDIKMKGSFKVYNASPEPIDADVVPDLTYTHHYGF